MIAILLALATQVAHDPRLVGDWVPAEAFAGAPSTPTDCATDFGVTYAADGTWRTFFGDERGTWRMEGDRLVETLTHVTSQIDDRERRVRRRPTRHRVRWIDADRLDFADAKSVHGLERCPPEPAL